MERVNVSFIGFSSKKKKCAVYFSLLGVTPVNSIVTKKIIITAILTIIFSSIIFFFCGDFSLHTCQEEKKKALNEIRPVKFLKTATYNSKKVADRKIEVTKVKKSFL